MNDQLEALPTSISTLKKTPSRKSAPGRLMSSEADLLREISAKLDRVVAVLAIEGKERERQVEILAAAGCDSNFIGTVVGMTAGAVRTLQSRQRKKAARTHVNDVSIEAR